MSECPICGNVEQEFLPFGKPPRPNEVCTQCGSLCRHRSLYLFLRDHTNFFKDNLRVLHFAARGCFKKYFQSLGNLEYNTADIKGGYDHRIDMESIQDDVGTFDVIIAIHVLEHIKDDIRAMREIYRILNPGGWAILQVPIKKGMTKTYEDSLVDTDAKRENEYGQSDHLRLYGEDYPERLRSVGFRVDRTSTIGVFGKDVAGRHRLSNENIHQCFKDGE